MALIEGIPDVLGPIVGLTESGFDFINIGINIILATLVGGIIILITLSILGKKWGETIKPVNAFLFFFLINIINIFGIMGILVTFLVGIPFALYILPLLIWIVLMKAFFGELEWKHAVIAGIVGYILSIFVIPTLIAYARGFIPI